MKKIVALLSLFVFLSFSCKDKTEIVTLPELNPEQSENYYEDLYKYYHATPETQAQKDENAIIDYIASKRLKPKRTASGLYYQIIQEGYGANFKSGDVLTVHYVGTYLSTEMFDSSYSKGEPITFRIGEMIAGWNEGLTLMKPSGRAVFIIPSNLAYKEKGYGNIPPNTPLVFELGILE